MYDPRIRSHNRSAGNHLPAYLNPLSGNDALEDESGCGMQTECFFDASVEVGEFLTLGPCRGDAV